MLLAHGLDIKRATLAFWVGYAAAELMPVFGCANSFLTSGKIAVDETVAPVLDPGRGRTKKTRARLRQVSGRGRYPPAHHHSKRLIIWEKCYPLANRFSLCMMRHTSRYDIGSTPFSTTDAHRH